MFHAFPTRSFEFQWKSNAIFQGDWSTSIVCNGKSVSTRGGWLPVCEVSEPTHKYLELEARLEDGLRIQRHFFVSYEEELMILADSVLPSVQRFEKDERKKQKDKNQEIRCEMRIPLAPGIIAGPGEPNGTERILRKTKTAKKSLARIFPLALPQKNTEETTGNFGFEMDTLVLRQHGTGNALFAPVFFDLSESRQRHSSLWQKLTVGENREKVPLDRAAGYRIQTHGKQYLLYRSLTPQRNRTVLGVNLVSDLFFASFCPEKGAEMILELTED